MMREHAHKEGSLLGLAVERINRGEMPAPTEMPPGEQQQFTRLTLTYPPPHADEEDLLKPREVAKILRVDVTTVRRWIKKQLLPAILLPHQGKRQEYRIRRSTMREITTEPG